ncbi:DUF1127 domain-containing protein [Celeribacter marinus]|nr:DUF1127 domain-containing protein [Celeribacter marinus]SFK33825.1 protein of unknown function [Celeribacter marinus]
MARILETDMAYATQILTSHDTFAARVERAIDGLRHWRAQRAEFTKIYNELASMTDRDLADIGISHGQIREIAEQAAAAV